MGGGAQLVSTLSTKITGSFNQAAIRYGHGIANGGDGGNTRTWLTHGAPDLATNKFSTAYSFTMVDHFCST